MLTLVAIAAFLLAAWAIAVASIEGRSLDHRLDFGRTALGFAAAGFGALTFAQLRGIEHFFEWRWLTSRFFLSALLLLLVGSVLDAVAQARDGLRREKQGHGLRNPRQPAWPGLAYVVQWVFGARARAAKGEEQGGLARSARAVSLMLDDVTEVVVSSFAFIQLFATIVVGSFFIVFALLPRLIAGSGSSSGADGMVPASIPETLILVCTVLFVVNAGLWYIRPRTSAARKVLPVAAFAALTLAMMAATTTAPFPGPHTDSRLFYLALITLGFSAIACIGHFRRMIA